MTTYRGDGTSGTYVLTNPRNVKCSGIAILADVGCKSLPGDVTAHGFVIPLGGRIELEAA